MGCNCGKKSSAVSARRPASSSNPVARTSTPVNRRPNSNPPASAPVARGRGSSFRSRARSVKNTMVVSEEEKERRLTLCRDCPHFRPKTTRCGQCGCFLNIKAKLAIVSCPIGQW